MIYIVTNLSQLYQTLLMFVVSMLCKNMYNKITRTWSCATSDKHPFHLFLILIYGLSQTQFVKCVTNERVENITKKMHNDNSY